VTWLVLGALLPSLLVSWLSGFAVRRLAPRWGLVDHPGHRKVHARPTPLGGGLAIWAGIVAPLAALVLVVFLRRQGWPPGDWLPAPIDAHLDGLWRQSARLAWLLGAGTVLMLLGLADDRRGLDWRLRLAVQSAVAGGIVASGWQFTLFVEWRWLTAALSVLWIVGLINSFNMLDNMDGLSGGVAAIAAAILAATLLSFGEAANKQQPQFFVAGLLLVAVGATLGFLWHNRPPARLFMGDAGSYLLGYLLAVSAILGTYTGRDLPRHNVLAPLFVLAVPLYDTATVIWIRLRQGRSPFVGDKSHFSHRLVELGLSKGQAVATIYLTTATCGLGALVLHQVNAVGAGILLGIVGCVLVLIAVLESAGRRGRSTYDSSRR
jgi:UDP-GlcNAc:undecaprenyl-phosphate GlcNAc-1-phosphate transferase